MKWSKRLKKTFGKKTRETDATQGSFRYPPKPDSYYTKIEGQCRWCGNMILNEDGTINSRRNWHENCSEEYMFYYHSGATRQKVYERDLGKCNYCGDISTRWELDHINPLSEQKNVPRDEMDWSYWSMENLQTLCYKCHKKKSGKEISEKFKLKREDKKKVNWKKIKGLFE